MAWIAIADVGRVPAIPPVIRQGNLIWCCSASSP
jgi:hypothetical protein